MGQSMLDISEIHYHMSTQKKFEDPTPTPSATKFCEHKKGTSKTANFYPLFGGSQIRLLFGTGYYSSIINIILI